MEFIERATISNELNVSVLDSNLTLPIGSVISPYITANKKKLSKEAMKRRKYSSFSYYKLKDGTIIKGIFLDTNKYLQVSRWPFVNDKLIIKNFKQINDAGAIRLTVNYGLLLGERNGSIVLKKVNDCVVSEKTSEIDTVNDNFEKLSRGNSERFNKLGVLLKDRNHTSPTSVRATILEEGENATVIDYDPFFIEREYLMRFK